MTGEEWDTGDCNTKLIGARYYPERLRRVVPAGRLPRPSTSPRVTATATAPTPPAPPPATTASHVAIEGREFGKISGMAPAARIAAYKVCFDDDDPDTGGCYTSDSVAAIDDAVADGVDVINYSISGAHRHGRRRGRARLRGRGRGRRLRRRRPPATAARAPSTRRAHQPVADHGRRVDARTTSRTPWCSATASKVVGASISDTPVPADPLVDSADVAVGRRRRDDAALCGPTPSTRPRSTGKIVVCTRGVFDRVAKSAEVKRAGGVGDDPGQPGAEQPGRRLPRGADDARPDDAAARVFRPTSTPGRDRPPRRSSSATHQATSTPVPQVAGFSSRGPALANDADLLKPDIAAPGVSVLAAVAPPSNSDRDFDLYSGTSMASPHIAGLAAFMHGRAPRRGRRCRSSPR